MKPLIALLNVLLLSLSLNAQITLVKDIAPGAAASSPLPMGTVGGKMIFFASDGATGSELWATDGTTANTSLLMDINPGATGSFMFRPSLPFNGKLYFVANDGTHGVEPWVTDGTVAGTMMLKDISPGVTWSYGGFSNFTVFNGKVYFAAADGTNGDELWVTDGTSAGTKMVKDINPGGSGSDLTGLVTALGKLFFIAQDATHGFELWSSDGTAAGTTLVADLNTGSGKGINQLSPLFAFNGKLYFPGTAGSTDGEELYSSDGATITLVKNINIGPLDSKPANFTVAGGKLFFTADNFTDGNELWMTDGTPTGTVLVKDIDGSPMGSNPFLIGEIGGKLLFSATTTGIGTELWTSDGTASGTTNIKDIKAGSGNGHTTLLSETYSKPGYNLTTNTLITSGKYYFSGTDGNGTEVWVTDGTAAGTKMLTGEIGKNPTTAFSAGVDYIVTSNNILWIKGNDGNSGAELFKYDLVPNTAGVSPVKFSNELFTLYPNPCNDDFTIHIPAYTAAAGQVITVYDMLGRQVYSQVIQTATTYVSPQNLSKGIYTVRVQWGANVAARNLTVE